MANDINRFFAYIVTIERSKDCLVLSLSIFPLNDKKKQKKGEQKKYQLYIPIEIGTKTFIYDSNLRVDYVDKDHE